MEAQRKNFEEVFQDHLNEIQRLIARHTTNPEDRLDLTQEVFLRAYSAFSQFRGESSISTWLYRITINVCANAQRSRERCRARVATELDVDLAQFPSGLEDVVEDLARAETQRMLKQALRSLSAEQLVVLCLRFSDGLTLGEISEVTGAPVDTVKSRLKAALHKIHSTLALLSLGSGRAPADLYVQDETSLSLDQVPMDAEKGAGIYHNLGSLYVRKGLIEAALLEWRKAQKVDPTFLDPYLASAQHYIKQSQPQRAVETLETAVGKIQSGELHTTLAQLYLDLGDVEEGMQHSLRAIELEPQSPEAHCVAGRAYYNQAELQEALRSLTVNPGGANDSVGRSDWQKAASHFRQAIELRPDFAKARSWLAIAYTRQNLLDAALMESREAVRAAKGDDSVAVQAGWVHYRAGKLELAARYLRHSLQSRVTADKLSILGDIYFAWGRNEEAYITFTEALNVATDKRTKARLYSNLAATAIRLGKFDDAVEASRSALELDPDQVHARCNLSEAYLAKNEEVERVVRLCREGLQLAPSHICFHRLLAEALLRQNSPDDALREATTAIELEPQKGARWVLRARVLLKLGRREEAARDLQTALELDPQEPDAKSLLSELSPTGSPGTEVLEPSAKVGGGGVALGERNGTSRGDTPAVGMPNAGLRRRPRQKKG